MVDEECLLRFFFVGVILFQCLEELLLVQRVYFGNFDQKIDDLGVLAGIFLRDTETFFVKDAVNCFEIGDFLDR